MWRGRLWSASPVIVIEDDVDRVVLWRPRGTVRKAPVIAAPRTQGIMQCLATGEWKLRDHEWDVDNIWLMRPGYWSAIWVGWQPGFEPWGWYVNLQEPFVRRPWGFQFMDLMLDVIVNQDRSWRWKDEGDFQGLRDYGLIDAVTAATVRAEATRVIGDVEAGRSPFCDAWHDWRPDPAWGVPVLPDDWDEL